MSTPSPKHFLSALFSLCMVFTFPAPTTPQECPYPCYPPPTGTGSNPQTPPSTTTLTPPSSQTAAYYYPPPSAAFVNYPPPSGYLPYSPPTFGVAPPPPEPILPWFPYYYRKPPFQSVDQSSSANDIRRSTFVIVVTHVLCFLIFLSVL